MITDSARERLRRLARTSAIVVFAAIAGLWLLYVVAANVVLARRMIVPWVEPSGILLRYDRAWTLFPGRIHVDGYRMTMQDRHIEWSLDLARADFQLSVVDLLRRRFHVTRLRGDEISFRFRMRLQPRDAEEGDAANLPPIAPYDDPPIAAAGPPSPDKPDARYRALRIDMDDVDASVREIWIQDYRWVARDAPGRVRGAFELRPSRTLWVGPAELVLAPGEVSIGGETWLRDAAAVVHCTVTPFDVRTGIDREFLAYFDGNVALDALVASDAALRTKLPDHLRVTDGSGRLSSWFRFEHGVLQPGSFARYETDRLAIGSSVGMLETDVVIEMSGRTDAWEPGAAVAWMKHPTLRRGERTAEGSDLRVEVTSSSLATDANWQHVAIRGRARSIRAPDLGILAGIVPGVDASGAAEVAGEIEAKDERVRGWADASMTNASVREKENWAKGTVRARLREVDVATHGLRGTADVRLDAPTLDLGSRGGKLAVRDLAVEGKLGSASSDLRLAARTEASGKRFHAASPDVRVQLTMKREEGRERGIELRAEAHRLDAAIGEIPVRGDAALNVALVAPSPRAARLSADLDLRNATIGSEPGAYWLRVALRDGVVGLGRAAHAEGSLDVRARDGKPLLDVLRTEDAIPDWIPDALASSEFRAAAHVTLGPALTEILFDARDGAITSRGRIAKRGKKSEGAFYVKGGAKPLSAGFEIRDGKVHVEPGASEDWMREHAGGRLASSIRVGHGADRPEPPRARGEDRGRS